MKIKHLVACCFFLILISCNDVKNVEQTQPIEEISPEVLGKSNESSKLLFSGRSYKENLITTLFDEATDKNKTLNTLVNHIRKIQTAKYDSIRVMNNFFEVNNNYYAEVNNYLENIEDTVLRAQTRLVFETSQKQFETMINKEKNMLKLVNEKSDLLAQQLILMKLYVTNSMMKNYQKANIPDTKPLEDLIKNYDVLIQETEAFIEQPQ